MNPLTLAAHLACDLHLKRISHSSRHRSCVVTLVTHTLVTQTLVTQTLVTQTLVNRSTGTWLFFAEPFTLWKKRFSRTLRFLRVLFDLPCSNVTSHNVQLLNFSINRIAFKPLQFGPSVGCRERHNDRRLILDEFVCSQYVFSSPVFSSPEECDELGSSN